MAGSVLTQSLSRFTLKTEQGFEEPFLINQGAVKWSVASDRKWVVCVKGAGPFKPPVWAPEFQDVRMTYFTRMVATDPPEDAISVPLGDLLEWAKQAEDPESQITVGVVEGVTLNIQRGRGLRTRWVDRTVRTDPGGRM